MQGNDEGGGVQYRSLIKLGEALKPAGDADLVQTRRPPSEDVDIPGDSSWGFTVGIGGRS